MSKGKDAVAVVHNPIDFDPQDIISVETVGREDLSGADVARTNFLRRVLEGKSDFFCSEFIRRIWLPTDEDLIEMATMRKEQQNRQALALKKGSDAGEEIAGIPLNTSQAQVVRAMTGRNSFTLVHGP